MVMGVPVVSRSHTVKPVVKPEWGSCSGTGRATYTVLCADTFVCGTNLKLRQANARAQAKVARVCRGLATPLVEAKFCDRP